MPKPNGAMSSPFTGFANEMKNTGIFGTVGTEQNLPTREDKKAVPVQQPVVSNNVNKFTPEELGTLIVKLQPVGQIVAASLDEISINVNGSVIKIHK